MNKFLLGSSLELLARLLIGVPPDWKKSKLFIEEN